MLDDISRAALKVPEQELRSLLGCFLFSGDDVFKPLGVLSGGERNRYALARILVSPSNFLLLDEPTNHLDMRAKDVLLDALAAFSGTVVFVSHDRYFIDRLATRVLEVEAGFLTAYEGNYEDYLRRKEAEAAGNNNGSSVKGMGLGPNAQGSSVKGTGFSPYADGSSAKGAGFSPYIKSGNIEGALAPEGQAASGSESSTETAPDRPRRLNPIKQKQMEDRCAFLEEEVPRIESSIALTEQQLAVYVSAAETQRLATLAEELRAQLAILTAEWEDLMMQLDCA
jgi:ATP-binding cassette subfamily F protein 3